MSENFTEIITAQNDLRIIEYITELNLTGNLPVKLSFVVQLFLNRFGIF